MIMRALVEDTEEESKTFCHIRYMKYHNSYRVVPFVVSEQQKLKYNIHFAVKEEKNPFYVVYKVSFFVIYE